jgi:polyhydroxyalkanoate synthesis regulator phasin
MVEPVSTAKNVLEALAVWARQEGSRVGELSRENVSALLRELGFVTQAEHEDLELRVAQLEHRIRLLERAVTPVTLEGDGAAGNAEPQPPL